MMTFNGNHHWVWPLVPTSRAYSKLREYFAKLQNSKIEVLQAQANLGENLSVQEVLQEKTTIPK